MILSNPSIHPSILLIDAFSDYTPLCFPLLLIPFPSLSLSSLLLRLVLLLGRMANVLGCAGTKPSVTLTVAGRKLLELVYKAVPSVLLVSLASLPLQQQTVLKKVRG